ncbi:NAD(P)/FAD-dependent oxidoreductase [Microbacterium marinilacus]|uniref:FAD-binding oxidoreductase n=1 Tax=Microbacterium marinilacus TaxID=415209 RepID=A0ABP7BJV5_9MICO|nr:FAD-binding oxidoreductase [Microbacterium marinilacus]MBY0687651.1 FAD-binding oxidoreductase [Microbacterium marinilacus]
MRARTRIAVVGAGVIGMAVARELAVRGAEVTIVERDRVGAGASGTTFAWVNSNGKAPESYHQLNVAGLRAHRRLQARERTRAPWFVPSGTIEWSDSAEGDIRVRERVERLEELAYPVEEITVDRLRKAAPGIEPGAVMSAWRFPAEGYVHPALLLARLWDEAREHGARLIAPASVVDVVEHGDVVTLSLDDGGEWIGDQVVIAAGRWSSSIALMLGRSVAMIDADLPGRVGCSFLGYTAPMPVQLGVNLISPALNLRPDGGGRMLLQSPRLDRSADPSRTYDRDGPVGRELLRELRRLFPEVGPIRLERMAVGQRSRPADGLPAVGRLSERAYLAVAHSGITLSLVLGELVAAEMLDDDRSALLDDYAPDRLLGRTVADFSEIRTIHFPADQ